MKKSLMLLVVLMAGFVCVSGVNAENASAEEVAFDQFVGLLDGNIADYNAEYETDYYSNVSNYVIEMCAANGNCQEYVYENGILTLQFDESFWSLSKAERESKGTDYYDLATIISDTFIEMKGYDEFKVITHLYKIMDNGELNINTHGIEMDEKDIYTAEEHEAMQKELEDFVAQNPDAAGGLGYPGVYVPTVLKIDLVNGLKNYDESTLPGYIYIGEEVIYDAAKSDSKLEFRFFIEFSDFDKVYVNDSLVDPKYYTATEGSTIITFNNDYIKTLKNGKYNIKVTDKAGEFAETIFTVKNMPETVANPKTGITNPLFIGGLGIIAAIGVVLFTNKKNLFSRI